MPKSKRISAYPKQYFQVFQKAIMEGSYSTPLMSQKQRDSLIFDLNGFRRALHSEDHPMARETDQIKVCRRGKGDESFVYFESNNDMGALLGNFEDTGYEMDSTFDATALDDEMDSTIADILGKGK